MQRPGVQAAISLDILILRFLAGLVRRAGKLNTDLQVALQYITFVKLSVHLYLLQLRNEIPTSH